MNADDKLRAAITRAIDCDGPGQWSLMTLDCSHGGPASGAAGSVVRKWPEDGIVIETGGTRYRARWERQGKRSVIVATEALRVTLVRMDRTADYGDALRDPFPTLARVFETYLYDRDSLTCICEATPSRFLTFLRADGECEPPADAETQERLNLELSEADTSDAGHYRYKHDVDAYERAHPDQVYVDPTEYESLDDAIEAHQANHML